MLFVIIAEHMKMDISDEQQEHGSVELFKFTVDDVDVDFLPLIYEIIRR